MMLLFRNIFFTVLIPGTVTVVVPHLIVSGQHGTGGMPGHPISWLGLLPVAGGAAVLFRCIWDFAVTGRGTLAPVDPPTQLVVRGLYRYVRNPMYLGVLCILLGEAWMLASAALVVYAAAVFCAVHLFVVLYEERALRRKFGESYEQYMRTVHRWWPRRPTAGRAVEPKKGI
jgi:protein-S-isoprenylcysteine O-methyltransferase Ste14